MAKREYQEGYISPEQAILELKNADLLQNVRYPDQALRRLLSTGAIEGIKPPEKTPKLGWEVNAESLADYVRIQKLSPEDLRQELVGVKFLRAEVEELRAALEATTKERDKLQRKVKRLEPATDKGKRGRPKKDQNPEPATEEKEEPQEGNNGSATI